MELADARESLDYWEQRAQRLPRRAVRKRREARELAARWRVRVADAEREQYGRGLVGLVTMLVAERRAPQSVRRAGRAVAFGFAVVAAWVMVMLLLVLVAALALVSAVF